MRATTIFRSFFLLLTLFLASSLLSASERGKSAPFPVFSGVFKGERFSESFDGLRRRFGVFEEPVGAAGRMLIRMDTVHVTVEFLSMNWDTMGGDWMNGFRQQFSYDGQGKEIEQTQSFWLMNAWLPQSRIQRHYDGYGRLTRIYLKQWNGGAWINQGRDTLIYNALGDQIEERFETFNGANWTPYQRFVLAYDGSRRPIELIASGWSGTDWVYQTRYATTYDVAGSETEFLTQAWGGALWVNAQRETYAYDANGNRTEVVEQYWSSAWFNNTRDTRAYDENDLLVEEITQVWISDAWANNMRYSFSNNVDGNTEQVVEEYWDGIDWANERFLYVTYDGLLPVEQLVQRWSGSQWENEQLFTLQWQQVITTPEITAKCPVNDKWNMVSVPLRVADPAKTVVFPTAVSNAFAFDAAYTTASELENGKGYWLKFDGAQEVSIAGLPVTSDTFDIAAGWNMVGSIGVPVDAASAASIPPGLISSNFFGFGNAYTGAATIEPGRGYWVKFGSAGKLVLDGSGNTPLASRLRMTIQGELPPAPPSDPADEVAAVSGVPAHSALAQNYPNPFNPVTTISYTLASPGRVVVAVYNALGQEVARLLDEERGAGAGSLTFDAGVLPSGVYTYRIVAGDVTESRKMLLLR